MLKVSVEKMNSIQIWMRNFSRAGHHKKDSSGNARNEKGNNRDE